MTLKLCFFLASVLGAVLADHYFVKEGNQVCIIMDTNITGVIKYPTLENTTDSYSFNVSTSRCGGVCGTNQSQNIAIEFFPNGIKNESDRKPWTLTLWFAQEKSQTFVLKDYSLRAFFYVGMFNASEDEKIYEKDKKAESDMGAEEKNGFTCSTTALSLGDDSTVSMKNLRIIAFANLTETEFPKEQPFEQCALDARTSEIVPIVVGSCLAMLVIVVLIAYLIGRARAKRQGYASV